MFNDLYKHHISIVEDERRILDRRNALICMLLAEPNRDKKKRTKPFTVQDFMPGEPKKPQTTKEQKLMIEQAAIMLGGTVGRNL